MGLFRRDILKVQFRIAIFKLSIIGMEKKFKEYELLKAGKQFYYYTVYEVDIQLWSNMIYNLKTTLVIWESLLVSNEFWIAYWLQSFLA